MLSSAMQVRGWRTAKSIYIVSKQGAIMVSAKKTRRKTPTGKNPNLVVPGDG